MVGGDMPLNENMKSNHNMKKHALLVCSLLISVTLFAQKPTADSHRFRILFDDDGNSNCLFNCMWNRGPLAPWQVDSCVNIQAGTQVTSYAICAGGDYFNYRSKYGRVIGDDLNGTLKCGDDTAAYKSFHQAYLNHLNLEAAGSDVIRRSLTQAKKKGMETVLTLRMNDLHFNDLSMNCPIYFTEWWLNHPQFWTNDSTQGWHSAGALDFVHKEVRARKLDYVKEQLGKYGDVLDVYLLDYMRFFSYFKTGEGPGHVQEMTQMMREIRSVVDEESRKRNKKILLAVRIAPTLADNMRNGIDVREWLKESLLDFVCIGIHIVLDPNMPVAEFRRSLGKDLNVPLYPSCDVVTYTEFEDISEGMYRGFCSNMLSQGADGLELFNYYFQEYNCVYHGNVPPTNGGMTCRKHNPYMLNELGSLETLEGRNKIYWLSDGKTQYGLKPNTVLPLSLTADNSKNATIYVGDRMKKKRPEEVILFVRTKGDADMEITLNGRRQTKSVPSYTVLYDKNVKLGKAERQYAVTFPSEAVKHGDNVICFKASKGAQPFIIKRTELALKYGDVKKCGYF